MEQQRVSRQKDDAQETGLLILQLKKEGLTFSQIGESLNMDRFAVSKLYHEVLSRTAAETLGLADELRAVQTHELKQLSDKLFSLAMGDNPLVWKGAISLYLKVGERLAKLHGLDKVVVGGINIDKQAVFNFSGLTNEQLYRLAQAIRGGHDSEGDVIEGSAIRIGPALIEGVDVTN